MQSASSETGTERATRAPTARTERRIARAMAVELCPLGPSPAGEATFTENVSPRGARVVTRHGWKPEERLLLKSLQGDFRWQARVVYCERLPNNAFAVGLDLLSPTGEWRMPH